MSNISREDDLKDLAERTANGGNRPNVIRRKTKQEIADEHYRFFLAEEFHDKKNKDCHYLCSGLCNSAMPFCVCEKKSF